MQARLKRRGRDATDLTSDDEDATEGTHWDGHVEEAKKLLSGAGRALGRPPDDLADVVAEMGLSAPETVLLRALSRVLGGPDMLFHPEARTAAGYAAWGLLSRFNLPETTALVRARDRREPYWMRALEYSAAGCLQAVMDKYAHVLRRSLAVYRMVFGQARQEELVSWLMEHYPQDEVKPIADKLRIVLSPGGMGPPKDTTTT